MERFNFSKLLLASILLSLTFGCLPGRADNNTPPIKEPTPTLHPFFVEGQLSSNITTLRVVQPAPTFEPLPTEAAIESITPTPDVDEQSAVATPSPTVTVTPAATATPEILPTVTIYDETLNKNWSISTSSGVNYVLQKRTATHNGTYAIAMTPTRDYGNLAFTVKFGSSEVYLRDETVGVRFWLYSGDATIGLQDLAVSVVGSNENPYWKWNDSSVTNVHEPVFSETRLQYLGFNNAIPPKTWVQVEVILDNLQFDPTYKYVTGIYILNGEDFRDTIYIDQLELVKTPGSQ